MWATHRNEEKQILRSAQDDTLEAPLLFNDRL
jgi:hypothetical protein